MRVLSLRKSSKLTEFNEIQNSNKVYFTLLVKSGEDWLSLMVVVRVVVSVTEVLRCLRLRGSVCSAAVVSVGAVSVDAGSD